MSEDSKKETNSTQNLSSSELEGNVEHCIANLKIIQGDYDVEISSKLITRFAHKEMNVQYLIALEKTSTYGV